MNRERQTILSLLALGRITPREAERLLVAWNAGRDEVLVIAACVAAGLAQVVPAVTHLLQALLPGGIPALHHAVAAIAHLI
jgi:hypothetical protein